MQIKEWLIEEKGVTFVSETDSEVIAHLITEYYEGNLFDAVHKAVEQMSGAYAVAVVSKNEPDKIIAVRKDSPLIVGKGIGANYLASDIPALLNYTRDVYLIENDEYVVLTKDEVKIYDKDRNPVQRDIFEVDWNVESAEKEGFEHFTLKEIYEQPKGIKETLFRRLDENDEITLDNFTLTKEELEKIRKVTIVACGTAYHAGLVGKYAIEKLAKIPVETDVASEFRYNDPFVDEHTLFIAISQSGETIDTLQALREAKGKGAKILSIVNVVGSSIARDSENVFYTWAGPEIGVASTKAYTTQLISVFLIALKMARILGRITDEKYTELMTELKNMPQKVEIMLERIDKVKELADTELRNDRVFFIGRGVDYYTSLEASLKFKEITYTNSFAIQAGELKHGTIALAEPGSLAVAICTQDHLFEKMLSNIKEVKARGAKVFAIAKESNTEIEKVADKVLYIPDTFDLTAPFLSIVPMQLFAYYVSHYRGNDVDKPRNLAKSVTVE